MGVVRMRLVWVGVLVAVLVCTFACGRSHKRTRVHEMPPVSADPVPPERVVLRDWEPAEPEHSDAVAPDEPRTYPASNIDDA
ncbi:MAG: hypothetical protein KC417_11070, partial [Myxococcales bacterium]|nr:hypothetical protein [Myxococcales bacterium]